MEHMSKPPMPDNAEDTVKCPICGAMVNVAGVMGSITCPVCGRAMDRGDAQVIGASNEGF